MSSTARRAAGGAPSGSPAARRNRAEPLVEQPEPDPVAPRVEAPIAASR